MTAVGELQISEYDDHLSDHNSQDSHFSEWEKFHKLGVFL